MIECLRCRRPTKKKKKKKKKKSDHLLLLCFCFAGLDKRSPPTTGLAAVVGRVLPGFYRVLMIFSKKNCFLFFLVGFILVFFNGPDVDPYPS